MNCDPSYRLGELNKPWGHTGKKAEYYKGFIGIHVYSKAPEDYDDKIEHLICPFCGGKLVDTKFLREELHLLGELSNWNRQLLDAMMELHEKDPIEYQLKIQQFKTQFQQEEQKSNSTVPHCPTCNSTNIKKISTMSKVSSVAIWGVLSRKIHKQWHCNSCGSEW